MNSENGFDNVQFFVGIVEDNQDPTNNSRVRVRAFGIHPTYESGDLPTKDLPWSLPINGSYGAASQIPRVAEWVFGVFLDGRDAQHPFVMGSIPGQILMSMFGSGKPNASAYMRPSEEARRFYGAPALRPAQSGENLHETQLVLQDAVRRDEIPIAFDGHPELFRERRGWSEPTSASSSNPAKTTIFSSPYGDSYIEVCGQEGNEFVNISHASGSQVQIDQHGDIKIRSMGDMYSIAEGNVREYTGARKDVFIDGKYTIKVSGGDCTLEVDGDLNHVVHGDYYLNVAGRMTTSVGLGYELIASRATIETVGEHINLYSAENIQIECGAEFSILSEENVQIKSGENVLMSGDKIGMYASAKVHAQGDDIGLYGKIRGYGPSIGFEGGGAGIMLDTIVQAKPILIAPIIKTGLTLFEIANGKESNPVDPPLAWLTNVDRPTTAAIAFEGNQSGMFTTSPRTTTTGGAGNPNSANVTDDTDEDWNAVRKLPAKIDLDNGIGRPLGGGGGHGGGARGTGGDILDFSGYGEFLNSLGSGLLWKPESDSRGGRLAILLPSRFGEAKVTVNGEGTEFAGFTNGNRGTYFAPKPGGQYGGTATVNINGVNFKVNNTGNRQEVF